MLRFYIDEQEYTQDIDKVTELSERVYWAKELNMYLREITGAAVAVGSLYSVLRALFDESISAVISCQLVTDSGETIDGSIFLNDVQWHRSKRAAEFQIVADPYLKLIDNNKGIEITLGVGTSKNGVDISSRTVTQSITFTPPFIPTMPPYPNATGRLGWRIFDVFNYMIGFMSDGQIGFVSDYFGTDTNPSIAYTCIMTGREVLYAGSPPPDTDRLPPTLTFEEWVSDINKLFNISMVMEIINGLPYLRCEPKGYWANAIGYQNIGSTNNLITSCDRELFYSTVRMGSKDALLPGFYRKPLSYYGHQNEQFFFSGQSNINNELSLNTDTLVFDTNALASSLPFLNGGADNTETDEYIFIVHCDNSNTAVIEPAPFSTTLFNYNIIFLNQKTAERWAGNLPFALVQVVQSNQPRVISALNDTIFFEDSSITLEIQPQFPSESLDVGGEWNTGIIDIGSFGALNGVPTLCSYFEAASTDYFQLFISFLANFSGGTNGAYAYTIVKVARWNGTFYEWTGQEVTLHNITQAPWGPPPDWNFNQGIYWTFIGKVENSAGVYLEAGDIAYVYINYTSGGGIIYTGTAQVNQYGGIYAAQETDNALMERAKCDMPISDGAWSTFKANPFKVIQIGYTDGIVNTRLKDVQRNLLTGKTSFDVGIRRAENA